MGSKNHSRIPSTRLRFQVDLSTIGLNRWGLLVLIIALMVGKGNCSLHIPTDIKITVKFYPSEVVSLVSNTLTSIFFNCSIEHLSDRFQNHVGYDKNFINVKQLSNHKVNQTRDRAKLNERFILKIRSKDLIKVALVETVLRQQRKIHKKVPEVEKSITTYSNQGEFTIMGKQLGHTELIVDVILYPANKSLPLRRIYSTSYKVSVIRKPRQVDHVFNCVVAALALLVNFGIGCATSITEVRDHLKNLTPVYIGLACHFLGVPLLALALTKAMFLKDDFGIGTVWVSVVPGGGLGFLIVIIMGAERSLSLALYGLKVVISLGAAPIWLFALAQLFPDSSFSYRTISPLASTEMWLVSLAVSYAVGVLVNYLSQTTAETILNWFVKPVLLLSILVFVTVGMNINKYIFEDIEITAILAGAFLPLLGFILGLSVSIATKQEKGVVKTIAVETAVSSGIIAVVAIRFSLNQPSADLASAVGLWVMLLTPATFVVMFIGQRMKHSVFNYMEKHKQRQYEQFSIINALSQSAKVAGPMSAFIIKKCEESDDENTGGTHDDITTV